MIETLLLMTVFSHKDRLTPVALASALTALEAPIVPGASPKDYLISFQASETLPKLQHRRAGLLSPTDKTIHHIEKRTYRVTAKPDGDFTYLLSDESPDPFTFNVKTGDVSTIPDHDGSSFLYFSLYLPSSQPFLAYATVAQELGLDLEPIKVVESMTPSKDALHLQGLQTQIQQGPVVVDHMEEAPVRKDWKVDFKRVGKKVVVDVTLVETHGVPVDSRSLTDKLRTDWQTKFETYWTKHRTEHIEVVPK